jgi:hypothetical protein
MERTMTQKANSHALQAQCDAFNQRVKIGDAVDVRRDNGRILRTWTTTEAHVMSGHSAVVFVEGIRGCYALERVTKAPEEKGTR